MGAPTRFSSLIASINSSASVYSTLSPTMPFVPRKSIRPTGSGAASVTLPFSPRKITVFAQGKPPVAPRADGGWDVFSQVWLQGEESPYGTGGISLAADTLAAQFSEGAFSGEAGLYHALTRSGVTYVVELEP